MFFSIKRLSLAIALALTVVSVNSIANSEAEQIDKDLVQMRQMIDQMKEQGAPEDTIAEAEKNLEMMKAIAPMMKAIENDSVGDNKELKAAAEAVKKAESETDGLPALEKYVDMKKATVDAKQASELQAALDAMKQMLTQSSEETASPPPVAEEESEEDEESETEEPTTTPDPKK